MTISQPRIKLSRLLALPALLWVLAFGLISIDLPSHPAGETVSRDFGVYFRAAEEMTQGRSPYLDLGSNIDTQDVEPYLYPPPLAWALQALTPLGQQTAAWIWFALNLVATAAAVVITLRSLGMLRPTAVMWGLAAAFAYFPVQENLRLGNVSALLMLSSAVVLASGPAWRAGTTAAAALLKVFPASMGVAILARDGWRGATIAAGAGLLIAAPSFVTHPQAWFDFFSALVSVFSGAQTAYSNTLSPAGFVAFAWPDADWLATAARVIALGTAATLLVLAAITARRPNGWPFAATAALLAGMLVPSIMWNHYAVALVPAAIVAFARATPTGRAVLALTALPLFRVAPVFLGAVSAFAGFWIGCAVMLLLLWPRTAPSS